jgi:hypothetical protein
LPTLVVATLFAGCGETDSMVVVPDSSTVLTVVQTGGLCPYGGCHSEMVVFGDGTVRISEGDGTSREWDVGIAAVAALVAIVAETDFDTVRSVPFEEVCPTAYDGSQFLYTFTTETGTEEIDSCLTAVDSGSKLFQEVGRLIQP